MQPIKNLWKQAHPSFKLPSHKKLSTTLLNVIYNETKLKVQSYIDNCENLYLISDGW